MLKDEDFIPKADSWSFRRENGLILSDYQIMVLNRKGIDYKKFQNMNQILFEINDILDLEEDEELESVARELDEKNYYSSKKN